MRPNPPRPPDTSVPYRDPQELSSDRDLVASEQEQRRASDVLVSDVQESPEGVPSPTREPFHFRRPITTPGSPRSASHSPPPSTQDSSAMRTRQKPRPRSNEFNPSKEIRSLWPVERHQSHQEPFPDETYPALPESHSTSAATSVRDPEECDEVYSGVPEMGERNPSERGTLVDDHRMGPQSDLLDSQQATPTAATFRSQINHRRSLSSSPDKPTSPVNSKGMVPIPLIGGSASFPLHEATRHQDQSRPSKIELRTLESEASDITRSAENSKQADNAPGTVGAESDPAPVKSKKGKKTKRKAMKIENALGPSSSIEEDSVPREVNEEATARNASVDGAGLTKDMGPSEVVKVMTMAAGSQDVFPQSALVSAVDDFNGTSKALERQSKDKKDRKKQQDMEQDDLPGTVRPGYSTVSLADGFSPTNLPEDGQSPETKSSRKRGEGTVDVKPSATTIGRDQSLQNAQLPDSDNLNLVEPSPKDLPTHVQKNTTTDVPKHDTTVTPVHTVLDRANEAYAIQATDPPQRTQAVEETLTSATDTMDQDGQTGSQLAGIQGKHGTSQFSLLDESFREDEIVTELKPAAVPDNLQEADNERTMPVSKKKSKKGKQQRGLTFDLAPQTNIEAAPFEAPQTSMFEAESETSATRNAKGLDAFAEDSGHAAMDATAPLSMIEISQQPSQARKEHAGFDEQSEKAIIAQAPAEGNGLQFAGPKGVTHDGTNNSTPFPVDNPAEEARDFRSSVDSLPKHTASDKVEEAETGSRYALDRLAPTSHEAESLHEGNLGHHEDIEPVLATAKDVANATPHQFVKPFEIVEPMMESEQTEESRNEGDDDEQSVSMPPKSKKDKKKAKKAKLIALDREDVSVHKCERMSAAKASVSNTATASPPSLSYSSEYSSKPEQETRGNIDKEATEDDSGLSKSKKDETKSQLLNSEQHVDLVAKRESEAIDQATSGDVSATSAPYETSSLDPSRILIPDADREIAPAEYIAPDGSKQDKQMEEFNTFTPQEETTLFTREDTIANANSTASDTTFSPLGEPNRLDEIVKPSILSRHREISEGDSTTTSINKGKQKAKKGKAISGTEAEAPAPEADAGTQKDGQYLEPNEASSQPDPNADADPPYNIKKSKKDKKKAKKTKAVELDEEAVVDETFETSIMKPGETETTKIQERQPDGASESMHSVADEIEPTRLASRRQLANEVLRTELDDLQNMPQQKGHADRAQDSIFNMPGNFEEDDHHFQDKNMNPKTDQGRHKDTNEAFGFQEKQTESLERPIAGSQANSPGLIPLPETGQNKDNDDSWDKLIRKGKKDKKKRKSVTIASEDPEIITDPPVKFAEPSEIPPIDTPLSVGSVDLLDPEEEREYKEEYKRELDRQLNGDAEDSMANTQIYDAALSRPSARDVEPSSSEEPRDMLTKATSLEDIPEEPKPSSNLLQNSLLGQEDDLASYKPTKKSKKGKKNKKQQQPIIWEDNTATEGIAQEAEPYIEGLDAKAKPVNLEGTIHHESPEGKSSISPIIGSPSLSRTSVRVETDSSDYFGLQPSQRAEASVGQIDEINFSKETPALRQAEAVTEPDLIHRQQGDRIGQRSAHEDWDSVSAKRSMEGNRSMRKGSPYEATAPAPDREDIAQPSSRQPSHERSRDTMSTSEGHSPQRMLHNGIGLQTGEAVTAAAATLGTGAIVAEGLSRNASRKVKKDKKSKEASKTAKDDELSEQLQASQQPAAGENDPLHIASTHSTFPTGEPSDKQSSIRTLSPTHDDFRYRDSAIHVADSPLLPESDHLHRAGRDSGYPDTETSAILGNEARTCDDLAERDIIDSYGDRPERQSISSEREVIQSYRAGSRAGRKSITQEVGRVHPERSPTEGPFHDNRTLTPEPKTNPRRSRRTSSGAYDSDDSADSGFDIQKRRRRLQALAEEQREPSPVSSTTKDRSSALFDSSPSARYEPRGQPLERKEATDHPIPSAFDREDQERLHGKSILEPSWSFRNFEDETQKEKPSIFGDPVHEVHALSRSRSPASGDSRGRQRVMRTFPEPSHEQSPYNSLQSNGNRSPYDVDSQGSGRKAKKSSRKGRNSQGSANDGLVTEQSINSPSRPPVDEEKHSIDVERSQSRNTDRISSHHSNAPSVPSIPSMPRDLRSPGIGSPDSIHAIIRTPDQVRSASGQSMRSSGTPPLRRVDRSASGDLRRASKKSEAKKGAKISEEAEHNISIPSSSTYDPLTDKGKGKADMADYVSQETSMF